MWHRFTSAELRLIVGVVSLFIIGLLTKACRPVNLPPSLLGNEDVPKRESPRP